MGHFGLTAGSGVLDAAEPTVEAHAPDALLVAREAQPDLLGGARPGLGGEVGVGDLAAHDADEIAMALGECPLGLQRILEPSDAHDRQVDGFANRRRDEERVPGRHVHRRLDHEEARRGHPDRRVDVVDLPGPFDELGDADGIVDRRAALDQLVTADPDTEGEPVADHAAHGGDDLDEQPRSVLEGSAVAVRAPVRRRGEEAPHDRRVRALQLDPVESTFGAVLGDRRVTGHDLLDLCRRDRLRHLPEERIGDRRRRPHREPGVHRAGLTAVVVDLGEDRHPVAMHRLGDPSVAGDDVAMEAVDELLVRPVGRMGRVLLGDDQPGATRRPSAVVRRVLLGGFAVAGVVREVGAEHDPVAGGDRADRQRCPEVPVRHHARGYEIDPHAPSGQARRRSITGASESSVWSLSGRAANVTK